MDSKFNFNDKEEKIYEKWEKSGAFECKKDANKKPFVVVMPPNNELPARQHIIIIL